MEGKIRRTRTLHEVIKIKKKPCKALPNIGSMINSEYISVVGSSVTWREGIHGGRRGSEDTERHSFLIV
jgi:hypothetical protein